MLVVVGGTSIALSKLMKMSAVETVSISETLEKFNKGGSGTNDVAETTPKPNPNNIKVQTGQQDKHIPGTNNYNMEDAKVDELIKEINKYPNGTILVVKWENNLVVRGKIDTIYETDNGLDVDEEGYQEFYACLLDVLEILSFPAGKDSIDEFIEISIQNSPLEVELDNNVVIWRNANFCLPD